MPLRKVSVFFMLMIVVLAAASGAGAQDGAARTKARAKAAEQLQRAMAGEPALTEADLKIYQTNLETILALNADSAKISETLKKTGWTENRLGYVTTKVSVGLAELLEPDSPNLKKVPAFARPADAELALIKENQDVLVKALSLAQLKGAKK